MSIMPQVDQIIPELPHRTQMLDDFAAKLSVFFVVMGVRQEDFHRRLKRHLGIPGECWLSPYA